MLVGHGPRFVDLDWLMGDDTDGRANTLYLIAPDTEFKRLAPVLGGLLGDFREQLHAGHRGPSTHQTAVGRDRRGRPTRVVVAARGGVDDRWARRHVRHARRQSKAQIDHRYGTLADVVLADTAPKVLHRHR